MKKYSFDCPYLNMVKNGVIRCECAAIKLPDKESRAEFVSGHCGHPTQYKKCTFYKLMDDYYRRLYSTEVVKW